MTELDDLRRVAFGRTSNAAEEAAAVEARAALAQHEANDRLVRAEHEASEFTRARANERDAAAGATPGREAQSGKATMADRAPEPAAPGGVTLDVVEVYDEPGYLHRLGATWRVWAVPAFAAFVVGIALTVASGLLVLNTSRTTPAEFLVSGDPVPALQPGDLARASELLAREQDPEDVPAVLDPSIDATTTHLLRAGTTNSVFAGMSTDGNICLIVIWTESDSSGSTCAPPSEFALRGAMIGSSIGADMTEVRWDGRNVTESWSTP